MNKYRRWLLKQLSATARITSKYRVHAAVRHINRKQVSITACTNKHYCDFARAHLHDVVVLLWFLYTGEFPAWEGGVWGGAGAGAGAETEGRVSRWPGGGGVAEASSKGKEDKGGKKGAGCKGNGKANVEEEEEGE